MATNVITTSTISSSRGWRFLSIIPTLSVNRKWINFITWVCVDLTSVLAKVPKNSLLHIIKTINTYYKSDFTDEEDCWRREGLPAPEIGSLDRHVLKTLLIAALENVFFKIKKMYLIKVRNIFTHIAFEIRHLKTLLKTLLIVGVQNSHYREMC